MKFRNLLVFGSLLITVTLFSFMRPPKVTVADILRDPGYYDGKKVELEGVVLEYDVSPDEIACYLKGKKDSIIRIELRSPLNRVYCKFLVTGIVPLDPGSGNVFVEELQSVEKEDGGDTIIRGVWKDADIIARVEVE